MRTLSLVLLISLLLLGGVTYASDSIPPVPDDFWPGYFRDVDFEYSVTYEDYMANCRRYDTEIRSMLSFPLPLAEEDESEGRVAILVNSELYPKIQDDLIVWVQDINNDGFEALLVEATFETIQDLRAALRWAWESEEGLVGCIVVGDFPVPWYRIPPDESGYIIGAFPCDLYFEDLDGDFIDSDDDGVFDSHVDGDGDTAPDIWLGRLLASRMSEDEDVLIRRYLQKNHLYRIGELIAPHRALLFVDDDSVKILPIWWEEGLRWQYEDILTITDFDETNAEEYLRRLEEGYEWVTVVVHSSPSTHAFYYRGVESRLTSSDIQTAPINSLFHKNFGCSTSRYVERDYIGGWYIFGGNSLGLIVIGDTKESKTYVTDEMHQLLSEDCCIGAASTEWLASQAPYTGLETVFYYGLTTLGDPTLRPVDTSPPMAPKNFRSRPTAEEDGKIIFWSASDAKDLAGYRLYYDFRGGYPPFTGTGLPQGDSPIEMGFATSFTVTYEDASRLDNYTWAVTAFDELGNESRYSEPLDSCGDPALNPPAIIQAGWEDEPRISSEAGGQIAIYARVIDDEDVGEYLDVELLLNGQRTGLRLYDDGTHGDGDPHDGFYSLRLDIPAGLLQPGRYLVSIIATDSDGNCSDEWPYLTIPEDSSSAKKPARGSSFFRPSTEPLDTRSISGFESGPRIADLILYPDSELADDAWAIVMIVYHPESKEDIREVQLYSNQQPTGIILSRYPENEAYAYAYFKRSIRPEYYGLQPGKYLIEAVATDKYGNQSDMLPYLYVE
ncbi:MAG: hypothetical protein JW759_01720 [Candidatus Coatesbacteria bacterium]|nr:hypothetical protein [Candidatus Coatesbacteria bacterium]